MSQPNQTPAQTTPVTPAARTLYEKLFDAHVVRDVPGETPLIYIDRHYIHEVTSPQAFEGLRMKGRKLRRPEQTIGTMDHNISTQSLRG